MLVAWPGWGPLPRLADEAGGVPVPVRLGGDGAPDAAALAAAVTERTRVIALCSPNDPTGGEVGADGLRRLAATGAWILLDAALADFGETDLAPLTARARAADRRALVLEGVRDGGLPRGLRRRAARAGRSPRAARRRLRPRPGRDGVGDGARRARAAAPPGGGRGGAPSGSRPRSPGSPLAFPAGTGPLVWLSSARDTGAELAEHLASRRIYVTPGASWGDDRHVRVALRGPEATDRLAAGAGGAGMSEGAEHAGQVPGGNPGGPPRRRRPGDAVAVRARAHGQGHRRRDDRGRRLPARAVAARAALVASHPELLELIRGSMASIINMGARARIGETSIVLAVLLGVPSLMMFDWVFWLAGKRWGDRVFVWLLGGESPRNERRLARLHRLETALRRLGRRARLHPPRPLHADLRRGRGRRDAAAHLPGARRPRHPPLDRACSPPPATPSAATRSTSPTPSPATRCG